MARIEISRCALAVCAVAFCACTEPGANDDADHRPGSEMPAMPPGDIVGADASNTSSYEVQCDVQGKNCCTAYPLDSLCFYMSLDGDDDNDGLSELNAVRTLEGAQEAINGYVADHGSIQTHIEVRIEQGVYLQTEGVDWTYYTPGYYTYFLPTDYKWGAWGSFAGRPVFWGAGTSEYWFQLLQDPGEFTRIAMYYLEVVQYGDSAVVFHGDRDEPSGWNGYNMLYGMYMSNIGNKWAGGNTGYAGAMLVNSRNNFIRNSHFVNLENVGDDSPALSGPHIHAVYMANWASHNLIEGNNMRYISGDPVRVRNDSSDNDIRSNVMHRTGSHAQISDFYQDVSKQCNTSNTHTQQECPSWRNWYRHNTVQCGYDGGDLPQFFFFGSGKTQTQNRYCVPAACVDHDPLNINVDPRLETASNTVQCP